MCGIIGYIGSSVHNLERILPVIKHRGPDGSGTYYNSKDGYNHVGFGHVRLSIIDPNACSNQPLFSACGNYVITYNGEIYNYKELRDTYLADYSFNTNSDTEVILALYRKLGKKSFSLLHGMFAFAIHDKANDQIVLVRDQLGIKPLYLCSYNESIYFASEIKVFKEFGINSEIDDSSISEFLINGFIYEPETGFKNITKLRQGHYLELNLSADQKISYTNQKAYWLPGERGTELHDLEKEICQSIEEHLVSDVEVGLFFSGGVDSSILLSHLGKSIRSLTVKSHPDSVAKSGITDDYYYARKVAEELGVSGVETIQLEPDRINSKQFLQSVEEVSRNNEELISDYTFISSRLISASARKSGLKVVLSGMGADELFGGYPRYVLMRYYNLLQFIGKTGFYKILSKALGGKPWFQKKVERFNSFFEEKNFVFKYSSLVGYFSNSELKSLLKPEYQSTLGFEKKAEAILSRHTNKSPLKKSMIMDLSGFLSHNFAVADKSSMAESIEVRVPLATKQLFDLSLAQPDKNLVSGFRTKPLLKNILEKTLSKKIVNRSKAGFNPPLDNYISEMGAKLAFQYMSENGLLNYCHKDYVQKLITEHYEKQKNNTYKIYTLLYLSSWLKNFTINTKS